MSDRRQALPTRQVRAVPAKVMTKEDGDLARAVDVVVVVVVVVDFHRHIAFVVAAGVREDYVVGPGATRTRADVNSGRV